MISVDCRSVPVHPTGLLTYQLSLARFLPVIAPHCHFQFLRHDDAPGRLSFHPNSHERFIKGDPDSAWSMSLQNKLEPDGLQLFHATGGLLPAGVTAPVVTTIHDVLWIAQPNWIRPSGIRGHLTSGLCRRFQHEALRRSARIIVPSQATRRAVEEVASFVADRIRVIPHGVGEDFTPLCHTDAAAVDRVRATMARLLPGAQRFVLDVGRATAYRNHDGLLRAFATAFRRDRGVHLALVQPLSEQTNDILKATVKLGIESRVHVLSGVASRDLVDLYQAAICLCHPSLHEAYGTVIAEAMACGCPVITSGRAGAGEIADGVARLVNPEHDDEIEGALRAVAYEPALSLKMRARGLARAATLEGRAMAQATWNVYQEVLESVGDTSALTQVPADLHDASDHDAPDLEPVDADEPSDDEADGPPSSSLRRNRVPVHHVRRRTQAIL